MPSSVDICNMALLRVGRDKITSLTENKRDAVVCNTFYTQLRDSVLREHRWSFATERITLAALTTEYEGWDYAYQYPTDCLAVQRLYNAYSDTDILEYEVASNAGTSRAILCDVDDAVIIYTAKITVENAFDPMFIEALIWRLAAELALALRSDTNLYGAMLQRYALAISQAKSVDANERHREPNQESSFLSSRL